MVIPYRVFATTASIDNRIPIILPESSPFYSIQIRGPAIKIPLTVKLDTGTNTTHIPINCFIERGGKNFSN